MSPPARRRRSCLLRAAVALLAVAVLLCGGLALATHLIVRRAEASYPPTAFVRAGGVAMHYAGAGEGNPVALIHGGSGRLQDFTLSPLFGPAAARFHVIALDRPGLGYSDRPART